jgi:hypothetical protein
VDVYSVERGPSFAPLSAWAGHVPGHWKLIDVRGEEEERIRTTGKGNPALLQNCVADGLPPGEGGKEEAEAVERTGEATNHEPRHRTPRVQRILG